MDTLFNSHCSRMEVSTLRSDHYLKNRSKGYLAVLKCITDKVNRFTAVEDGVHQLRREETGDHAMSAVITIHSFFQKKTSPSTY